MFQTLVFDFQKGKEDLLMESILLATRADVLRGLQVILGTCRLWCIVFFLMLILPWTLIHLQILVQLYQLPEHILSGLVGARGFKSLTLTADAFLDAVLDRLHLRILPSLGQDPAVSVQKRSGPLIANSKVSERSCCAGATGRTPSCS